MRYLASFMAILVILLSCVPCADGITISSSVASTQGASHEHHEDSADLCSPFCQCACCASFSLMTEPVSIPDMVIAKEQPVYQEALESIIRKMSIPIWQPPQLV
ncbi:DUF6660 family protein [Polluticoccus soli]|uniref:DUF6660 family protein n=1 Tax=Polluticoccus soli TaxID=3034150 RepID=UPI003B8366B7